MKNKNIAYCGLMIAMAMIFSYVESLIPISFAVPGMKLGLANIVTITGIYIINPWMLLSIVVLRIILTGFLFGNGMAIVYSLAGGLFSLIVMLLLKKCKIFSMTGISIVGGISHNIGQIIIAMGIIQNTDLNYYMPMLFISGTVTGLIIGIIGGILIKRIPKKMILG